MTRKHIYEIIEKDDGSNIWSHIYDVFMFGCIILSVVPLMFWEDPVKMNGNTGNNRSHRSWTRHLHRWRHSGMDTQGDRKHL